jgi:hypothetical protein
LIGFGAAIFIASLVVGVLGLGQFWVPETLIRLAAP